MDDGFVNFDSLLEIVSFFQLIMLADCPPLPSVGNSALPITSTSRVASSKQISMLQRSCFVLSFNSNKRAKAMPGSRSTGSYFHKSHIMLQSRDVVEVTAIPLPRELGMLFDGIEQTETCQEPP